MLAIKVSPRLAGGVAGVNTRTHGLSRPTFRVLTARRAQRPISVSQRTYATPGRPRKAVGEPSRAVKRTVKRDASETAKPAKDTTVLAKEKKEKAARIAKEKAERVKAKAAKQKEKALKDKERAKVAKEKAAAAKVKAKSKTAASLARAQKTELAELKKVALNPPKHRRNGYSAWIMFAGERLKQTFAEKKDLKTGEVNQTLGSAVSASAAEFKNLSPSELEHYNQLAIQASEAKSEAYKSWVESHSPDVIRTANQARLKLRRKFPKLKKYAPIKDDRLVKQPTNPYTFFNVERMATGDFKHIKLAEASKLVGQEWKGLSSDEKQRYQDLALKDRERYEQQFLSVYGHAVPTPTELSATA